VVVAIQVLNPGAASWSHSVLSLRPHLEFVPLFFLGYQVMRSRRRLRVFLLLLLAVTAVNGVVGLVQFKQTPEQLARWGPGYETRIAGTGAVSGRGFVDTHGVTHNRPFGLGSDMGFGGSLGALALPAALALLALTRRWALRLVAIALSLGAILAVATSEARVAVLGSVCAVVAFVLLAISSRNVMRPVVALAVGAALAYTVISTLASSAEPGAFDRYASIAPDRAANTAYEYRKATLARVPKYVVDVPLGAGLGSSGPGASATGGTTAGASLDAESEPTFLLIETGVPGLLVMLGLMVRLLALAVRRIRWLPDGELRLLLAGVAAPLFAIFAMGAAGITTAATPISPYVWFAAGVFAWWLHPDSRRPVERER
jgi:O-antigen ligase